MGYIARYFPALRRASSFFKRFRSKTLSRLYLAFQCITSDPKSRASRTKP